MAMVFIPIREITTGKESWNILAKVIRLWVVSDLSKHKIPFSIEMVLIDEQGSRIHATVKRTLVYKFQNQLKEGHVYSLHFLLVDANVGEFRTCQHEQKLIFQLNTKVQIMETNRVQCDGFDLVPIQQVFEGGLNMDFLVDVIGVLTGVGNEREYERNGSKTKLNVICLEADGHRIECTLFGQYVHELNTFLASGESENAVVIIQFAKIKKFQEKIHLQNCMSCTKLIFNPTCEAAVKLKKSLSCSLQSPSQGLTQLTESPKITIEEEFLELTPRNTVDGLKRSREQAIYVVFATVVDVVAGMPWWYTACLCSKAVFPDSNLYFCEKCYKHVMKVTPRYCIKVRVHDATGDAIFVIFDRDGKELLNKEAAELFEAEDKTGNHSIPKQICDLKGRSFLFKVEYKRPSNTNFEQSFVVKKICSEESVINKFNEMMQKDGIGAVGRERNAGAMSSVVAISEDLMPKFASADIGDSPPSSNNKGKEVLVVGDCSTQACKEKEFTPVRNEAICIEDDNVTPPISLPASQITVDLSNDLDNLTPLKRESPTDDDVNLRLKMLKKPIKIEKE